MVQQSSILPNYILSVGFGGYNKTKNIFTGGLLSASQFVIDLTLPRARIYVSPLPAPDYGEDKASAMGIRWGKSYYQRHYGTYLSTK